MRCLLCESSSTTLLREIEVGSLIELWTGSLGVDVREGFDGLSKFYLLQCRNCGLQYFIPNSLAGSPQLYAQLEKLDSYYRSHKWEYDKALGDLRDCRRVLEIGCGFGDFIALAQRERGLEIEGIEQNASAVQRAQARGLAVRVLDLCKVAEESPDRYDALCSFQVLEHVPNPREFLEACCTLLRSRGKLLLGLPDGESFLRHQFNILDMPPHHMTRWSGTVLRRLPALFPLRLIGLEREPLAEYHVEAYVDAYTSVATRHRVLRGLSHRHVRESLIGLLKRAGIRRLLRGQTVYAAYERV